MIFFKRKFFRCGYCGKRVSFKEKFFSGVPGCVYCRFNFDYWY